MTQTIYLIRHGNTTGTEEKLFYGSTDLSLTEAGRDEIVERRESGAYPSAEGAVLFTSGMLRTEQTFEAIYGELEHGTVRDLREIELGKFEMTTYEEVIEDERGRAWLNGEVDHMDFPGGDTQAGFSERVAKGMRTLRNVDGERVIAVLHGAVIAMSMSQFFPDVEDLIWRWTPNPGHGYSITLEDDVPVAYDRI